MTVFGCVLLLALFAYLLYALIKPERFWALPPRYAPCTTSSSWRWRRCSSPSPPALSSPWTGS